MRRFLAALILLLTYETPVVAATPTSIDVEFTAPTTNADATPLTDLASYRLYVSSPCPGATFLTVPSTTLEPAPNTTINVTISDLFPSTTYTVQVTAVDTSANESLCSGIASGSTLAQAPPVNVTGATVTLTPDPVSFASDNFNRADGAMGSNWTSSGYQVFGQRAMVTGTSVDSDTFWSALTWPADQFSQAKLYATGTNGAAAGNGLSVRHKTGKILYRLVMDHAASNNVNLGRFNGPGTYVSLITCTVSWAEGDTWRLEVTTPNATSVKLKMFKNAVQVCGDVIDTSASRLLSGGPGLAFSSGNQQSATADDWQGGGL